MKKILFHVTALAIIFFQSCSQPLEETKLEKYDITFTSPKLDNTPDFKDYQTSETDTELSSYDFNMGGHARIDFMEISSAIFPTDTTLLKSALSQSEDFVEFIDNKQFSNGAFGSIYKMKGSSGAVIKYFTFYFKKGNRYFKITPVFNTELNDLEEQLAAFASLK